MTARDEAELKTELKALKKTLDRQATQTGRLLLEVRALRTLVEDLLQLGRERPLDLKRLTREVEFRERFNRKILPLLPVRHGRGPSRKN